MVKMIEQRARFKTSPETLFELYIDSKKHSAAIGAKVSISRKEGSKFTAYDGWILGKNILIAPNKMIVQIWRGKDWNKKDRDSILILNFNKVSDGAEVHLVHVNVPDKCVKDIEKGWKEYYWKKWAKYLKKK
ncbi:MAG: SRPBCC domain-containing protein [Candidatus Woesearchaeota archaeon]|nr:MAG: SRPBCC domain-containing protein [Candidatus Woesearchaeota archaeon]